MHLMFLSPRNEPPEDIQVLISINSPKCKASTATNDMESGRGRGGVGGGGGSTSSPISPSDQREHYTEEPSSSDSFCGKYFSVVSFLLLVCVTASLVILPLILPPLPPPPSMLMLVPVAMLAVLLVLAFMPTSGGRNATGYFCYYPLAPYVGCVAEGGGANYFGGGYSLFGSSGQGLLFPSTWVAV